MNSVLSARPHCVSVSGGVADQGVDGTRAAGSESSRTVRPGGGDSGCVASCTRASASCEHRMWRTPACWKM